MGEINPALTAAKPLLSERNYIFSDTGNPVIATGSLQAGKAALVNLAPGPDSVFTLIAAPVEFFAPDTPSTPTITGWFRPAGGDIAALTKRITETAAKENLSFAVLMIGANDMRKMKAADTTFEFGAEGWEDAYKTRLGAVVETLRGLGKPVYIVGMPPVADAELNAAFGRFNEFYREAAFTANARFVDVWTVFLDADGQFTRSGPDLEGNETQLRWRDGIRFTKAGRRKLAHYVEREIRRDAGLVRGLAARLDGGAFAAPSLYTGPWADRPPVGPVISLTSPQVALDDQLLGDGEQKKPREDTPQYQFVVLGEPLQPPAGRVDDFKWPQADAATVDALPKPAPTDAAPDTAD